VFIVLTLNPSLLVRHWVKSAFMSVIDTRSWGLLGPEQQGTTVLRSNSWIYTDTHTHKQAFMSHNSNNTVKSHSVPITSRLSLHS